MPVLLEYAGMQELFVEIRIQILKKDIKNIVK